MTETSLSFLVSPGVLWWAGLLAAIGVGLWAYHRLAAPLSGGLRTLLRFLRVTALLLLLLILLQPLLTRSGDRAGKPRLAVLVDRSSSMKLPAHTRSDAALPLMGTSGAGGSATGSAADEAAAGALAAADSVRTRRDQAEDIMRRVEEVLGGSFEIDALGFAGGLEARTPGEGPYPWRPLGVTAMGEALEDVLLHQAESPAGAVLLVTDGAHTAGKDPALVARNLPLPVFAALVGDTLPPPDLLIRQVRVPGIGYVAEPLPVRVVLEHAAGLAPGGAAYDQVRLRVRELRAVGNRLVPQGPPLAEETVALQGQSGLERETLLELRPTRPGLTLFEVTATTGEPEQVALNNRRFFAAEIREKKTRILYLEGEPDWDFSFLKRTLDADTTLAYSYLVRQADDRWLAYGESGPTAPPESPEDLAAFAGIIIGRLSPGMLPDGFVRTVEAFVAAGGGALWLGGGQQGDLQRWRQRFGGLLPVAVQADRRWGFTTSPAQITLAGLTHELTGLRESAADLEELWKRLPPVWVREGQYSVSPAAVTLLSAQLAHPNREVPLFSLASTEGGRVAVFTGREFWRWDFAMRSSGELAPPAPEFWRRVMRWLTEPSDRDRFTARPARHVFQDSEPVAFTAQLFDESYQPVSGAGIRLSVEPVADLASYAVDAPADLAPPTATGAGGETRGGSESDAAPGESEPTLRTRPVEIRLYPDGPAGHYAGQLPALPPGMYRFEATASASGALPAQTSEGWFWIEEMGAEFYDLGAEHGLPVMLAEASGGAAAEAGELDALLSALPERYKKVRVVQQAEIWNHWALFGLVVLALALEWILRRRKGLA